MKTRTDEINKQLTIAIDALMEVFLLADESENLDLNFIRTQALSTRTSLRSCREINDELAVDLSAPMMTEENKLPECYKKYKMTEKQEGQKDV